MLKLSNEKIIETIYNTYQPTSITNLQITAKDVRFTNKTNGKRFAIWVNLGVEEADNGILRTTDLTHTMEAQLKRTAVDLGLI